MTESKTATTHTDTKAELASVKQQLDRAQNLMLSAGLAMPETEPLVVAKMRAGLSRQDAIVCARRQVLYDQAIAEADKITSDIKGEGEKFEKLRAADIASKRGLFLSTKLVEAGSHQLNAV